MPTNYAPFWRIVAELGNGFINMIDTPRQVMWGHLWPRPGFSRIESFLIDSAGMDPRSFTEDIPAGRVQDFIEMTEVMPYMQRAYEENPILFTMAHGEFTPAYIFPEARRAQRDYAVNIMTDPLNLADAFVAGSALMRTFRGFRLGPWSTRNMRSLTNLPVAVRFGDRSPQQTLFGNWLRQASNMTPEEFRRTKTYMGSPFVQDIAHSYIYDTHGSRTTYPEIRSGLARTEQTKYIPPPDLHDLSRNPNRLNSERWFNHLRNTQNKPEYAEALRQHDIQWFGPLGTVQEPPFFRRGALATPPNLASTPSDAPQRAVRQGTGPFLGAASPPQDEVVNNVKTYENLIREYGDKRVVDYMINIEAGQTPKDVALLRQKLVEEYGPERVKEIEQLRPGLDRIPTEMEINDVNSMLLMREGQGAIDAIKDELLRDILMGRNLDKMPLLMKPSSWNRYAMAESPDNPEIQFAVQYFDEVHRQGAFGDVQAMKRIAAQRPEWRDMMFNPHNNDVTHLMAYVRRASLPYLESLEKLWNQYHPNETKSHRIETRYPLVVYPGLTIGPTARYEDEQITVPLFEAQSVTELNRITNMMNPPPDRPDLESRLDYGTKMAEQVLQRMDERHFSRMPKGWEYDFARKMSYPVGRVLKRAATMMMQDIAKAANDPAVVGAAKDYVLEMQKRFRVDIYDPETPLNEQVPIIDHIRRSLEYDVWTPQDLFQQAGEEVKYRRHEAFDAYEDDLMAQLYSLGELDNVDYFSQYVDRAISQEPETRILTSNEITAIKAHARQFALGNFSSDVAALVDQGAVVNFITPIVDSPGKPIWGSHIPAMTPGIAETIYTDVMRGTSQFVLRNDPSVLTNVDSPERQQVEEWRHAPLYIMDRSLQWLQQRATPGNVPRDTRTPSLLSADDLSSWRSVSAELDDLLGGAASPYEVPDIASALVMEGHEHYLEGLRQSGILTTREPYFKLDAPEGGWTAAAIYDAYQNKVRSVVQAHPYLLTQPIDSLMEISDLVDPKDPVGSLQTHLSAFIANVVPNYEAFAGQDTLVKGALANIIMSLDEASKQQNPLTDLDYDAMIEEIHGIGMHMKGTLTIQQDLTTMTVAGDKMVKLGVPEERVAELIWGKLHVGATRIDSALNRIEDAISNVHLAAAKGEQITAHHINLPQEEVDYLMAMARAVDSPLLRNAEAFQVGKTLQEEVHAANAILKHLAETKAVPDKLQLEYLKDLSGRIDHLRELFQSHVIHSYFDSVLELGRAPDVTAEKFLDSFNMRMRGYTTIAENEALVATFERYFKSGDPSDKAQGVGKLKELYAAGAIDETELIRSMEYANEIDSFRSANPTELLYDLYWEQKLADTNKAAQIMQIYRMKQRPADVQNIVKRMKEDHRFADFVISMHLKNFDPANLPRGIHILAQSFGKDATEIIGGLVDKQPDTFAALVYMIRETLFE